MGTEMDNLRGGFCPPDRLLVSLLLDHSKAGMAVGAKGSMMQKIKNKSAADNINFDKDPIVSKKTRIKYNSLSHSC